MARKEKNVCKTYFVDEAKVKRIEKKMLPESMLEALADTFGVLGDRTRLKIIFALSKTELCVCDLTNLLGMQVSAISHQLRILRNLRLVKFRRKGRMVYYSLDDEHIIGLFNQGLEHIKE